MNDEYETYEVETEAGKFYIRILAAERKTFQRWEGDVSLPSESISGRVWLSTDPEFGDSFDRGHVKVRGRKYAIEEYLTRLPEDRASRWTHEPSYRGSFRSEQGTKVEYRAKTWDVLRGYVDQALDKFAEDYPEWERKSTLRLFERERSYHLSEAATLRRDAEREDIKAAEWEKRISLLAS